jgi:hypothetical protein
MAVPVRKLSRPSSGYLVLLGLATVLVLILVAAYHGSRAGSASECAPARPLLRRIASDTTGARTAVASNGAATAAQTAALQHDDDDLNNFLNGEQSPDTAFNGRVLPVANALGRVVTDLQAHAPGAISNLNQLDAEVRVAGQYCHAL